MELSLIVRALTVKTSADREVRLKDGRTLAYCEYGLPDGKPVLFFHGHPGSRLEFSVFDPGDLASELGLRIIAADRPGHGR